MYNPVTASAKQPRVLFCEFLQIPSGSVPWREEANADVQQFSQHYTRNHMNPVLHISSWKLSAKARCFSDDVSVNLIAATSQSVRYARFSFPRNTAPKVAHMYMICIYCNWVSTW